MSYKWTGWKPIGKGLAQDPYIHWSLKGPGEDRVKKADEADVRDGDIVVQTLTKRAQKVLGWKHFADLDKIVVPKLALNPATGGKIVVKQPNRANMPSGTDADLSTAIAEDTVIAGVIDVGMPLGHRRLRLANGKTRILSAWQMIGNWDLNPY